MTTTRRHSDLIGFVVHLAKTKRPTSLCDHEDFFQAGLLGLVRAERQFRGRDEEWEPYAKASIRNAMREAVLDGLAGLSGPRDDKRRAWRRCGAGEMDNSDLLLVQEGQGLTGMEEAKRQSTWPEGLSDRAIELLELRSQHTLTEIAKKMGRSVFWVWNQYKLLEREVACA